MGCYQRVDLPCGHDDGQDLTWYFLCANCGRVVAPHAYLRDHWRQHLIFGVGFLLLHISLRIECRRVRSSAAEAQLHFERP